MRKNLLLAFVAVLSLTSAFGQMTSDFESLTLNDESAWDGFSATLSTFENDLTVGNAIFQNSYTRSDWGSGLSESWKGFSYSKVTDNTTAGYGNHYSCIAGTGADSSVNYGVLFTPMGLDKVSFENSFTPTTLSLCNATYTYHSMRDGDSFAKKFGGEDGKDPDFLLLHIIGLLDDTVIDTIDFYLADYRFENNDEDYILNEWTNVDLSSLGSIDAIRFVLSSSDNGDWGMNTPGYFCVDNFGSIDFEDLTFTSGEFWNGSSAALGTHESDFSDGQATFNNSYTLADWGYGMTGSFTGWAYSNKTDVTTAGYSNLFSSIAGKGANNSETYALCDNRSGYDNLNLGSALVANSMYITNGTYAYLSMTDGDAFAKKFGGEDGNDPDFFMLRIFGYLNGEKTDSVDFYLADFRFEDNTQDYIVDDWEMVDLTSLGTIDQIGFTLSSSDTGDWGMNTPAYFFIDELQLSTSSNVEFVENTVEIKMYPNPATEMVTISSEQQIERVDLISISGQLAVSSRQSAVGSQLVQLNVGDLKPGVYLVRIHTEQTIQTKRLIIK